MAGGIASVAVGVWLHKSESEPEAETAGSTEGQKKALDPKEFKQFSVQKVTNYNHNTNIYDFSLPEDHVLGLDVASCLLIKVQGPDGKPVVRPYTPISSNNDKGFFRLMVKEYPEGNASKALAHLKKGDSVEVKGPIKKLPITPNMKKEIVMIAGGTGITPMYQVVNELLQHKEDKTNLTLIYSNSTAKDILMKERLDELAAKHPNFSVKYLVTKPAKGEWKGETGRFDANKAKQWLPKPSDDTLVMVCGPPPFMKAISGDKNKDLSQGEVQGILKDLGFKSNQVYKF